MSQLDIWRIQAFSRLETLIPKLQGSICAADGLIDTLVRALGELPARPADKAAYVGIFATSDVTVGRQKAIERLRVLRDKLTGECQPPDGLVDDLLRILSGLPKRPADKKPYESLFPPTQMRFLTVEQILKIAPEASRDRVTTLVPCLNQCMAEFEITTPLRQAHFLAQVAHESDRFNALEEYASGVEYEWRDDLGNIWMGDGIKFKGRGLIQVTGRANYIACGKALGIDLIKEPMRLANPDLACRSAGWFWNLRKLNPDADKDDVETITRVINGGLNGFNDRQSLLTSAKQVLGVS